MEVGGKTIRLHMPFDLPLGDKKEQEMDAASYYVRTLTETEEPLTLVLTGPMTNFALALTMEPDIVKNVEEIVIMGGGYKQSNISCIAESNIYRDPEAAQKVLRCGAKITMMPLDATHQGSFSQADRDRIYALGTPAAKYTAQMIDGRRLVYDATSRSRTETTALFRCTMHCVLPISSIPK